MREQGHSTGATLREGGGEKLPTEQNRHISVRNKKEMFWSLREIEMPVAGT